MAVEKSQKVWVARGGILFADSDVWEVDDVGVRGAAHHLGDSPGGAAVTSLLGSGGLVKVPGQEQRNAAIDHALQLSFDEYLQQTGLTEEQVRGALAQLALDGKASDIEDLGGVERSESVTSE